MPIQLSDCIRITNAQYLKLDNPKFEGQTRADKHGVYYMVWSCNGILYKTMNHLEGVKPVRNIELNGDMAQEFNRSQDNDQYDESDYC